MIGDTFGQFFYELARIYLILFAPHAFAPQRQ